jgi:predicted RNase H-like HicB family nuclease
MERSITLRIKSIGNEGYVARSDQVRDLFVHGRTVEETVENAKDVVEALVESCEAHGDPYPIETVEAKVIEKRIAVPAC